jgi:hypothetical protein
MKKLSNSQNLRGVFTNIAEARERRAYYDVFLKDSIKVIEDIKSSKDKLWVDQDQLLGGYEEWLYEYEKMVHDAKFELNRGNSEKSYVYARASFYAPDNIKNEIRVYMGSMDDYKQTIDQLKLDNQFLDKCEIELKKVMEQKLVEQIQILKNS